MKYLHLVWSALFRSRTRTLLTLLSVVTAFLLFGLLDSVRTAFNASSNVAGYDRMVVASRLSITQMLPMRLEAQIRQVEGVDKVARSSWPTRSGRARRASCTSAGTTSTRPTISSRTAWAGGW